MENQSKQSDIIRETALPLPLVNRGKVRDVYAVGEDKLLLVTSDRISAYDVVLPTSITDKGRVLNQISLFWFNKFAALVPNHCITDDINKMGFDQEFVKTYKSVLTGRSLLVHRAKPLPVECVVRGFLVGSGWNDYKRTGQVCGHALPKGLTLCSPLPEPLFTPSTKATEGHDINIGFPEVVDLIGKQMAEEVRDLSLRIYREGVAFARTKGIMIADTKFEFGIYKNRIILIDEVLTPDSSRFWSLDAYQTGQDQPSLDKQVVRDYLASLTWDKNPPGPVLPESIAEKTSSAYKSVFHKLTGVSLQ